MKIVHGHREGGICKHIILTYETLRMPPGILSVYINDSTSSFLVSVALVIDCTYDDLNCVKNMVYIKNNINLVCYSDA